MPRIRRAEEGDLPDAAEIFAAACGRLIEEYHPADRPYLPLDPDERLPMYRHLLGTGAFFIAEDPGPVGFASAVIRDGVWFLSQLWVHPDHQAGGLGGALLDEALEWGRGCSAFAVLSSVHPGARTLYLRRSMFPRWEENDMGGDGGGDAPPGARPLHADDDPWVAELDRVARGFARPEDHALWRRTGTGVAVERDGVPLGYAYVGSGPGGKRRVGPGAVRHPRDMPVLLRAALAAIGSGPVRVQVPSTNAAAVNELIRLGFRWYGSSAFLASRPLSDGSTYLSSGGALG